MYAGFILRATWLLATGAAAVPSVPPPMSPNAVELQQQLNEAASSATGSSLTVAPGQYVFSNTSLAIDGATDLRIDAHGVTFIFYYGFGVVITNCHNISVRGLTLDADPPNFAQGVVTSVEGGNNSVVTAHFDDQFLPPDTRFLVTKSGLRGSKMMFWDSETRLPMKSTLNFMDGEPNEAGGVWRVKLQIPLSGAKIPPVGALVTVFGRRGWTWQATNSSQVLAVSCRLQPLPCEGGNGLLLALFRAVPALDRNAVVLYDCCRRM